MSTSEPFDETSSHPGEQYEQPKQSRSWSGLVTPWWCITIAILAVSPFTGFVISWMGVTIATVATKSGQKNGILRWLASVVLVVITRLTVAVAVERYAYENGYAAAKNALAQGDEHAFAARELRGMWCLVDDGCQPMYQAWCGWRRGIRAALPENTGNPTHACEWLMQKGAKFSAGWWQRGTHSISRKLSDKQSYIADDGLIVLLEGPDIEDADLGWLQALSNLDRIEIDCPRVTNEGIKRLRKVQTKELVWYSRRPNPAVEELEKDGPFRVSSRLYRETWRRKPTIITSMEVAQPKPDRTAELVSLSLQRKPLSVVERAARNWHLNRVRAVALSPDGTRAASGGADRCVKVWDVSSRRVLWSQQQHPAEVTAVVFSDTGSLVSSVSRDGELIVWDAEQGEQLSRRNFREGSSGAVISTLSPDGRYLAMCESDPPRLRVWNTQSAEGVLVADVNPGLGTPASLAISPNGRLVAIASEESRMIDVLTGQMQQLGRNQHCRTLSFTPDGKSLSTSFHNIQFHDVRDLKPLGDIQLPRVAVRGIAFSRSSEDVIAGLESGSILIRPKRGVNWIKLGGAGGVEAD